MKCVFWLSKENIDLSKAEVLALTKTRKHELFGRLLFMDLDVSEVNMLALRLAYTTRIYQLLFSTTEDELIEELESYPWQKIYKKNFSLRIQKLAKTSHTEADLAGYIWKRLKNPKVNLEKPVTPIELIFTKKKIFCCLVLKSINKDFDSRKPHLKPGFAPTSLSPKLARGLVNLIGIKKGEVLDPFCGPGGILIEAGLIGLKPAGYDIDSKILKSCEKNMKFYKIKNYTLKKADALKINKKISYLVTDLPYGRNTNVKDINTLYSAFLKTLKKNLKHKAVVVFPDFVNHKLLIKKSKLKITQEFSFYIHKSLIKKIVVLSKN